MENRNRFSVKDKVIVVTGATGVPGGVGKTTLFSTLLIIPEVHIVGIF